MQSIGAVSIVEENYESLPESKSVGIPKKCKNDAKMLAFGLTDECLMMPQRPIQNIEAPESDHDKKLADPSHHINQSSDDEAEKVESVVHISVVELPSE